MAGEQVERDQGVTAEAGIAVGHDKPDAAARVARKPDHGGTARDLQSVTMAELRMPA